MKHQTILGMEVRCRDCEFVELWGLEKVIHELVRARKLGLESEFDADIFLELFWAHCSAITCPNCGKTGTLFSRRADPSEWTWDDAVYCELCGGIISPERLTALPKTKRCVDCQREIENSTKPSQKTFARRIKYCLKCGSPMFLKFLDKKGASGFRYICTNKRCKQ